MKRARSVIVVAAWLAACSDVPVYTPAATRVLVDASAAEDEYFGAPWPDDRRLAPDGTVDTLDFPNPNRGAFFPTVLETSTGLVRGWGLSAPIYIPFDGPIDTDSLPTTPKAARTNEASVFLVAVDPASPAYGKRVSLEWRWFAEPTSFLPGNVLALRPPVGAPLEQETKYALVVTTAVRDSKGAAVGPEKTFWETLFEEKTPSSSDASHWAPLLAYLDGASIARETIAGATLFTTQNTTPELLAIRDDVLARPAPKLTDMNVRARRAGFTFFEGRYDAPNYQHGSPPYEYSDGDFRFDENGKPRVATTESLRLSACIPDAEIPAEGFPVVIYSHGTGGDFESVVDDRTCSLLTAEGIAVFSMDQVLHGPRAGEKSTCLAMPVENCFFNIVNARSGRTTIQQSAVDNVSLKRLIESMSIDPQTDPNGRTVRFDTRHVGFFGHSQGALTGALFAAIDPELAGAALSAGGGHLTTSILERDDGELKALAEGPLFIDIATHGETLDQFHPALAFIQTLGEAADPLSWSTMWLKKPEGRRKHIFMTTGWLDDATPVASSEALAANAGVPQLELGHRESAAHAEHDLAPVEGPVEANIAAEGSLEAVTAGIQQFPTGDHFPIFRFEGARRQLATFLSDVVRGRTPSIPAEPPGSRTP